jgi:hypothetical protein
MMDEQEIAARLQTIKGYASATIAEADAVLLGLEAEPPPVEPPPVEPDGGNGGDIPPPSTQHVYLDPLWGGPIGSGGLKVRENMEWKGKEPRWEEKTDYVNPKMWNMNVTEIQYIGLNIPKQVRLFNPIFENITGAQHFIYLNHGHPEERNTIDFVIFGGFTKGMKAKNTWAEFKASKILIEDHVIEGSCSFQQYVRQRHGRQLVMVGGRGKGTVACRGWCHYVDVPGVAGQSWAGPLPYRSKDWMKIHTGADGPMAGKAYQGTELMYFGARSAKALVGVPSYDQPSKYPALNNIVHPDVGSCELKEEKGTKREGLVGYRELWGKAGLL